jgi:hypothetical protein
MHSALYLLPAACCLLPTPYCLLPTASLRSIPISKNKR